MGLIYSCLQVTACNVITQYSHAPVSTDLASAVSVIHGPKKKIGKLKKQIVLKFQNAHQARMGCNMVKSSSPNALSA
jgi:hypothetical protein